MYKFFDGPLKTETGWRSIEDLLWVKLPSTDWGLVGNKGN